VTSVNVRCDNVDIFQTDFHRDFAESGRVRDE